MQTDLVHQAHITTREFVLHFKNQMRRIYQDHDLTIADGRIMQALKKGQAETKAELAQFLKLKPAGLTRSLDRLVDQGYIQRKADENDKRYIRLSLTENGYALGKSLRQAALKIWRSVLKDTSEKELTGYIKLVSKWNQNFSMIQEQEGE